MTWRDVLFAHWAVDPATLESRLPPSLTPATFDGEAWLSVVAFEMADVRPVRSPVGRSFPELNLRTYVRRGEDDGVYFFSLDAGDRLGVAIARWVFALPYFRADMRLTRDGDAIEFVSRRTQGRGSSAAFAATYRPTGEAKRPAEGSLTEFLVENYRAYTAGVRGDAARVYYVDVDHPPWPIREATLDVRSNGLFEANGFAHPGGDPIVQYARSLPVRAGRLRTL
jgi:hypothetical protein